VPSNKTPGAYVARKSFPKFEMIGRGEVKESLVILFAGTKLSGELGRSQIAMEIGASRIVNLLQKAGQGWLVAQGQADCQVQAR
jgi:hypothetical protein